ncbi:hypothetical protein RIF29_34849 [Crotalaria pallida]|uniref:Uncharacterized protein n=1 Tax=Crotalaria pallida TaxID=3830 RepID=A0AAN9EBK2_CROPI
MNYENFITKLAASSHRTPSCFLPVEEHTPPAPVVPFLVPTTPPMAQEHAPPVRNSKKRIRWNEDEHRLFVKGVNKYGRGDWISISKYLLPSRTPSQIASHAQKYFIRQGTCAARKKRRSIHDVPTSYHAIVLDGADSQICTQQQQQTSGHAIVSYDADNQNCLPPLSHDWDFIPCDIATQQQQQ